MGVGGADERKHTGDSPLSYCAHRLCTMALCCKPYNPPAWIDGLEGQRKPALIPKLRVEVLKYLNRCDLMKPLAKFKLAHQLCMKNTPIHEWDIPQVPEGFQVSVKREDLTGSVLSGNKVCLHGLLYGF